MANRNDHSVELISREGHSYLVPAKNKDATTQTTQATMATMTMTTTTQSQGTVSAVSSSPDSDIIVLRGTLHSLNQQAQRRRWQALDYDSFMSNLLLELKKKKKW